MKIFNLEQILESNHVWEKCWGVTDYRPERVLDKVSLLTESPGCHLTEQFLNIKQLSHLQSRARAGKNLLAFDLIQSLYSSQLIDLL